MSSKLHSTVSRHSSESHRSLFTMFQHWWISLAVAAIVSTVATSRPWKRNVDISPYVANDTMLGKSVPCTDAEKECLRYNRLLYKKNGRCYPIGHGPRDCRFFVDQREFKHGEGHLLGTCLPKEQCSNDKGGEYLMAYDGQCLGFGKVLKICNRLQDLEPASHFFGGTECKKVKFNAPPPVYIDQPEESGMCKFPNLRHDFTSIEEMEKRRYGIACDADQSVCFAKGKVWYEPLRSCFPLLEQGPCEEGHRLVLKLSEKAKTIAAKCAPLNPCKSNQRALAFDGKCHAASLIRMVLCPTGVLLPNAFGHLSCSGVKSIYKHVIHLDSVRAGSCEIEHRIAHSLTEAGVRVTPDCSLTDAGTCSRAVNDLLRSKPLRHHNEVNKPDTF